MTMEEGGAVGKRVSWVELYFDLVFVFAVGQVAHHLIVEPTWRAVLSTLAVFATLWWTWIGFVLLYNRRGDDRRLLHRLVILAGTVPCAIAATQAHGVFEHHGLGFALALAGTRLVLAIGYLASTRRSERAFARRAALGYGLSGILFVLAAVLSALGFRPIGFVLWGYAILQEGVFLLLRRDRAGRRA
ncbi:MAG TPA: low temperature requirement protein A, partial [Micromonosporaceae bacterium]|nr:low temperature requirement protein A [Micromonosporaceae bacterium]